MASPQWGEGDEAQEALRAIVSNPVYGVPALSNAPIMANLLKDLLPDAPREVSILVAAAEAGVADNLRDRISQGMDLGTASAVVAGSFAASTPFRPEACTWAVSEMAKVLGLSSPAPSSPAPSSPAGPSAVPGFSAPGTQPTISAPLSAGPGGYAPGSGGYPPAAYPPSGSPPAAYPPSGFPSAAAPGTYPPGTYPPSGFPSAGQAPPPSPYSSAPASSGSAPSGYPVADGYSSPPVPGYWPQPPAPGFVPVTSTNGLAIASLVLGILWLFWVGSLVGLILGLVALRQIKNRNQRGRGIAIAGIVLGILGLVVLVIGIIGAASKGSSVS
jgi:Domain of unknown function (DUF4190)